MAYSKQNLAAFTDIQNGFYNTWVYKSADTFTTVKAANYISDALDMSLSAGDLLIVVETASPPVVTQTAVLTVTSSGATVGQTGIVLSA